jgi:hypothetical protein
MRKQVFGICVVALTSDPKRLDQLLGALGPMKPQIVEKP